MAPPTNKVCNKISVRIMLLILAAVCLCHVNPFVRILYAKEKDTVLEGSGIVYPGGYDLNTVGNIQGKVSGVSIPESGPISITLSADHETYIAIVAPGWYWKDMDTNLPIGTEITIRGSKSPGRDGKLYIIAQEISIATSKKTLVFRSESGKALWDNDFQTGRTGSRRSGFGSSSGGFGSPSGGRAGGGSSGAKRGRR